MRLFWILVALIVVVLAYLFFGSESSSTLDKDKLAQLSYTGIILVFLASSLLVSRIKLSYFLRTMLIWFIIFGTLTIIYNKRYELLDLGHFLTAGIIPASPLSQTHEGRTQVSLNRMSNGHFEVRGRVNDQSVQFLIDTGASYIALSYRDAQRANIDTENLRFTIPMRTANGLSHVARVRLDRLEIGRIERSNIDAFIARPGDLDMNLLGMNFLNSLSEYSVRADRFIMVD